MFWFVALIKYSSAKRASVHLQCWSTLPVKEEEKKKCFESVPLLQRHSSHRRSCVISCVLYQTIIRFSSFCPKMSYRSFQRDLPSHCCDFQPRLSSEHEERLCPCIEPFITCGSKHSLMVIRKQFYYRGYCV